LAIIANTFRTTSAVGNREELSDVVSRITPEDTPIYSLIEKGKCVSVHPEWETDELAAPAENIIPEGDEYNFSAITPPTRMGDYTQILRKDWIISNTQEVVSEAGNVQKRKYQKLKKGIEVRKDVEFAMVANTGSLGGAVRFLGSLPSWITTSTWSSGMPGMEVVPGSGRGMPSAEELRNHGMVAAAEASVRPEWRNWRRVKAEALYRSMTVPLAVR